MKKVKKIIFLPLLFLIVLSFFSCSDTNDPVPPTFKVSEIYSVDRFQFLKAKGYHIDKGSGLPYLALEYDVDQCNVIDTLYLRCRVLLSHWPADYSQNVPARVSSDNTGDVKTIYLAQDATGVGSIQSPNPPFVFFLGRIFLSDVTGKKSLKVSPYKWDILNVGIETREKNFNFRIFVFPQ